MTTNEPEAPPTPPESGRVPRLAPLRRIWPHALTAMVAVVLTLLIQRALPGPAAVVPIVIPTSQPASQPAPLPTAGPTARPLAESVARQELNDLRGEIDRLWIASYLTRSLAHLADGTAALTKNDFAQADQALVLSDQALGLAANRDSPLRDPIAQLRATLDGIRSDLYLRPEGIDGRIASLRQRLLALIEE